MDVKTLASVDNSLKRFGMLLKFAAPLLLFLSSALDAANNASYENTSDQERNEFPIPHVNFPFETILNLHPIFLS